MEEERDNWKVMKEDFIKFIIYRGSLSEINMYTCSLCF